MRSPVPADASLRRHHENVEKTMIPRLIVCLLSTTLPGSAAFAQAAPARAPAVQPATSAIPAPVDYRQLRAAEAPAGKYDWLEEEPKKTADDLRLERALRGVCRGC
jgi:hypothetical protein